MPPGANQNSLGICLQIKVCHFHPVQSCLQTLLPLALHYRYDPVAVLSIHEFCQVKKSKGTYHPIFGKKNCMKVLRLNSGNKQCLYDTTCT